MFNLPQVTLKPSRHNNTVVIQVLYDRNEEIHQILRAGTAIRWSKTMHCWYLPYSKTIKQELFQLLKHKVWIDYEELKDNSEIEKNNKAAETDVKKVYVNEIHNLTPTHLQKVKEFKYWMSSKRYSESTIGTYCDALKVFLKYYSDKDISEITNEDVVHFNNDYVLANKLSSSFQNQIANTVKLFFRTIENRKLDPELIHRPKRQKLLPNVLSKEEVKLILEAHGNIKHKAMLSLIYSCGLRRSELLNLRLKDIDSKRGLVIIRQGKGRKDRITPLSPKVLNLLRDYFKAYHPKEWLFEGQSGVGQYDGSSLGAVLKQSLEKTKINKPVTLHWLRHSYATHLLEAGTDLRYIQEILGHSRSTTTEIYTHVSTKGIQKVISPFDTL